MIRQEVHEKIILLNNSHLLCWRAIICPGKLGKGEEAQFKIIEFNKDFKRVVASHTAIFREEEKRNVKAAVKRQKASADEAKPTLGDANEALQALKDKMEAGKK